MKKAKKLLAILLCSAILLAGLPMFGGLTASAETSGYYTYTVSDGKATITKCDTSTSGAISIPNYLDGYIVTSIGISAFSLCDKLTSVTIPSSVTSIGNHAFDMCSGLTNITIPSSVTSIGEHAFMSCRSLASITIPSSVTSIGELAFCGCASLTSVTIPSSVTSIGDRAFYGCDGLTSITIPSSVTSIGMDAFDSKVTIYCQKGSYAQTYAMQNNIPFSLITDTGDEYIIPISTKEQLSSIRNDLSAKYYLTKNIVFTESDFAEGGDFYNSGNGWSPIGTSSAPFTGTFNGNGYSILNLFAQSNTLQYMGLFGYNCGTISNVIVSNSSFEVRSSFRDVYCGTLAGYNKGTITDSYCKGTVIAYSTAVDNNNYMNRLSVGGAVGYNNGEVSNCSTQCDINANYINEYRRRLAIFVGGVVGGNENKVLSCQNYSDKIYAAKSAIIRGYSNGSSVASYDYSIIGGVVGLNRTATGEVDGCTNFAAIDTKGNLLGCVVGSCRYLASITNCKNTASISNTYDIAGIVREIDECDIDYTYNRSYASNKITGCANTGNLKSTAGFAAGITDGLYNTMGYGAIINSCSNQGDIYAKYAAAGIAHHGYIINRSFNSGKVTSVDNEGAAGIVLFGATKVSECYNTGSVVSLNTKCKAAAIARNGTDTLTNCFNLVQGLPLAYNSPISSCYTIDNESRGYVYINSSKITHTIEQMRMKDTYSEFNFESIWGIDPDINNGYPYLTFEDSNNVTTSSFSYSHIPLSKTDNDLEYPIFEEEAFAKQLESWMNKNDNFEAFSAYLDQGYSYKDILYMTIDTPVMADDGSAYSVTGKTQIKDLMAYLVFANLVQKYFTDTMEEVENKISENKTSEAAYTYFLEQIKNFNTQYFYFQDNLNREDAFNQTLQALVLANFAIATVKEVGGTKVTYLTDLYKASVVESPEYYDDLNYYILSGGDTKHLNSYYKDVMKQCSTEIKNAKKLINIVKEDEPGDVSSWIDLGFANISYYADKYEWNNAQSISNLKKGWEWLDSGMNIVKAVSSGSIFGLMGASYSLATKYILEVQEVYEKATSTEAGWYALAYYYLEKENPDVLKAIVDPDTGAVTFSSNTTSSMALYGVPFDDSDPIQKNLMLFFETNLWAKQNTYAPSEKFKFYLWNAGNVANSITDIDCEEYRDMMIDYILAEINLENGQTGVSFAVTASSSDSSLGYVSGSGTYTANSKITLQAVPYEGVTFMGWKDTKNGSFITSEQNYVTTLTSEFAVEAVFVAGDIKADLPVIQEMPQNASYYKGQDSAPLFIETYVNDGGEISVDWYQSFTNTNANGIYVGSGTSFSPPTNQTGKYYYYAVVNNTVQKNDSTNVTASVKTKVARITVSDPIVTGLVISKQPNKTVYVLGESFSTAGMVVGLQYSDGTLAPVTDYELSYDFSTEGTKTVTVSCLGFVQSFDVEVVTVLNGNYSNGVAWKLDTVSGILTISGEGTIPNWEYRDFYAYIKYIKQLIIDEGVTKIGVSSFYPLQYLEQVQLPSTLHTICSDAFYNCRALKSVEIGETVTTIETRAFNKDNLLEIRGVADSTAENYALENGIAFNCLHRHIYGEWKIVVEATPDFVGTKHKVCTECGKEVTEEIPMTEKLAFKGASLTLQHNLEINYKVDKALFDTMGYTNPYVVFEVGGIKTTVNTYAVEGDRYMFSFTDIAPNQINDTIYATLYATYNGVEYASETKEYSVAQYCYNMLSKYPADEYAKLRTLLVDLLNYGAQSQLYTEHSTDALATANLTVEQTAWGTQEAPNLQSVMEQNYATVESPTVTWKGAGLNLKDSVTMRFKIAADNIDGLSVKVTGNSGQWTIDYSEFEKTTGGYYIYFRELNAGQMSEPVYLTVYDGDTPISNTIRYSIESYAYAKQNSPDEKLNSLLSSMMKYGNSAYAYIN